MAKYVLVAADTPFQGSRLTYQLSPEANFTVGQIVQVPLGKRQAAGVLWKIDTPCPPAVDPAKIKMLTPSAADWGKAKWPFSQLSDAQRQLYDWMARYYHFPLGQLIFDIIPAPMVRPQVHDVLQGRGASLDFDLTDEQQVALAKILPSLGQGEASPAHQASKSIPWLIHGITGSGKTAIYLSLMQKVLAQGRSVLFLLPEINLTPQFLAVFEQHLPAPIYPYHSAITSSEKFALWDLLAKPHPPLVVVGVRSAVFLPVQNLGLIIVDEEHDGSFKQEDRCPYNARDVAIERGVLEKTTVVLGSATPTISLWYQFQQRPHWREHYLTLQHRPGQAAFPKISILDVRQQAPTTGPAAGLNFRDQNKAALWPFLPSTLAKIAQAVAQQEQVLVLINQLGYARFIQCKACGQKFVCPNCSLNLKYFHQRQELACAYCDFVMPAPAECPTCGNLTFLAQGLGTEKVSLTLQELLPNVRVARFDRDALKNFKQISQRLQEFHEGKIDVLVGTQMLAKGHNFKKVNLVCVLGIDHALNFPDFRARERVYQLLTQISGRAGRYGPQSEVIIQTLNRDDQLFKNVQQHSFLGPYEEEIAVRRMAGCPPFGRLVAIYFVGPGAAHVEQAAVTAATQAQQLSKASFPLVQVLGPRPGLIEKVANKYRWTMLLKSSDPPQLHHLLFKLQGQLNFKKVSVRIDVDPYFLN